ncbi:MAG TPA: TraR/DksA family transcriptional regulator [Terriglobales bacterium]|nr:TraR/DksA family transcriptional regulator [Terriglobales bacterium]
MDKKKLEQFKKKLEQRQQELRRTVSRNVQDGRAADSEDIAQDIADKAANSYTKEFLFSQSSNDRALLARVEEALVRIREGSFGECVNCGDEVNAKRLEAVPWARYCIKCQEKIEQGQIQETRP